MDDKTFKEAVIFFKDECGVTEREAKQMACVADNIVYNANNNNKNFIDLVLFGLRNAYFIGENN